MSGGVRISTTDATFSLAARRERTGRPELDRLNDHLPAGWLASHTCGTDGHRIVLFDAHTAVVSVQTAGRLGDCVDMAISSIRSHTRGTS